MITLKKSAKGSESKSIKGLEPKSIKGIGKAARKMNAEHPVAVAAAILGAGVAVGVAAERILHHKPTVGETVLDAVKSGAARLSTRIAAKAAKSLK